MVTISEDYIDRTNAGKLMCCQFRHKRTEENAGFCIGAMNAILLLEQGQKKRFNKEA